jgi:hypothetical protein
MLQASANIDCFAFISPSRSCRRAGISVNPVRVSVARRSRLGAPRGLFASRRTKTNSKDCHL